MKYQIIYADPPWEFSDKAAAGQRGASFKYSTLSLEELKNLPIHSLAADDCFLFLWVVSAMLKEGIELLEAWGFDYKTIAFCWVKKSQTGRIFNGMGHYTRQAVELCLLGKRGHPQIVSHDVSQVIISTPREHSRKPDLTRNRIMKMTGNPENKLELFARHNIYGWDTFGNDHKLKLEPLENFIID